MITKSEIYVGKSLYNNGYIFPCNEKCLVAPACQLYCSRVFKYMNFIADKLVYMTEEEEYTYNHTTPSVIKRKIQEFHIYGKRLAYPESCTVSRDWK